MNSSLSAGDTTWCRNGLAEPGLALACFVTGSGPVGELPKVRCQQWSIGSNLTSRRQLGDQFSDIAGCKSIVNRPLRRTIRYPNGALMSAASTSTSAGVVIANGFSHMTAPVPTRQRR